MISCCVLIRHDQVKKESAPKALTLRSRVPLTSKPTKTRGRTYPRPVQVDYEEREATRR